MNTYVFLAIYLFIFAPFFVPVLVQAIRYSLAVVRGGERPVMGAGI